jgi:hypothetical protein
MITSNSWTNGGKKIEHGLINKTYLPWMRFLSRYPMIDLVSMRLGSLFMLLGSLLGIYVSIFGPFGGKS